MCSAPALMLTMADSSVPFAMKSKLDVQTERRWKEKSMDRRQTTASASPIDALSDDALYQIFCQCVKVAVSREVVSCCDNTIAPNNLAAVCKHWRRIALDSPVLWSSFICNQLFDSDWQMFQLYLDRAKDAPIRTIIDARNFVPEFCNGKLTQFLTEHQSHARIVDITYGYELDEQIVHLKHAPLLTDLAIQGYMELRVDATCRLDNLVRLHLFNYNHSVGLTTHAYLMLLQLSSNLEVFRASAVTHERAGGDDSVADTSELPDVYLAKLSILAFSESNRAVIRILLEKLHLPALKELTLDISISEDVELCGFRNFLLRSKPSLETLEANELVFAKFVLLLELSPALRNLTIQEPYVRREEWNALLRRLTITKEASLCPAIEILTFRHSYCSDEFMDVLECLILSRWRSVNAGFQRSLKTVKFQMCWRLGNLPDSILQCRNEGLEVVISDDED